VRSFSSTAEEQIAGFKEEIEKLGSSLDELRTQYDSVTTEVNRLFPAQTGTDKPIMTWIKLSHIVMLLLFFLNSFTFK